MKVQRIIALLMVLTISIGALLFGNTGIRVYVKDSFTKYPLDSVNVYLIKDENVIGSMFLDRVFGSPSDKPWVEFQCPNFFQTEETGKMELMITAPGHSCKVIPIEIAAGEEEIEIDKVFLDNINEPQNADNLIPKEKLVVKAYFHTDSLNADKDSKLREVITQFPNVSLDEKGKVIFNGEPVEKFQLLPFGTYTAYSADAAEALDIPIRFVSGVIFLQNESRNDFHQAGLQTKKGPLTMNVILKSNLSKLYNIKPEEKDDLLKWFAPIMAGIIVIILIGLGVAIYRNRQLRKNLELLQKLPVKSEEDSEFCDADSFRKSFVKRNMNGASDNELKILEDFVKRFDPDFLQSMMDLNLKGRDFHDALLIRLGVGLSECCNILNTSSSALGMKRLRMFRSLDDNRGKEKWEDYILSFSSQRY